MSVPRREESGPERHGTGPTRPWEDQKGASVPTTTVRSRQTKLLWRHRDPCQKREAAAFQHPPGPKPVDIGGQQMADTSGAAPPGLPRAQDSDEGLASGDSQASFIESVLSLLFLQKFDQYDQMQDALRSHLKASDGRRALARVLGERRSQWGAMTNKGVAERLVTLVALAFDQLGSQAAMDRVTGKQSFDKEAATSLNLVEMAQVYTLTEGGAGASTCLANKLGGCAIWAQIRFWNAMLDSALPVDGTGPLPPARRSTVRHAAISRSICLRLRFGNSSSGRTILCSPIFGTCTLSAAWSRGRSSC